MLYWSAMEADCASDLRVYGVVHFYPVVPIPLLLALFPSRHTRSCGGRDQELQVGVTDIKRRYPVIAAMERHDLPLLMHVEVTNPDVNAFDREAVFIERHLAPLVRAFPALRMLLERITTSTAADFVTDAPDNVAATITAHHHLLLARSRHAAGLGDPPEVVVLEIHYANPSVYSTNRSV